jgi:hypothetical protein
MFDVVARRRSPFAARRSSLAVRRAPFGNCQASSLVLLTLYYHMVV